jgi:multiple sugar transport system substrate-binding protein
MQHRWRFATAILLVMLVIAGTDVLAAELKKVVLWNTGEAYRNDGVLAALEPFLEANPDIEVEVSISSLYDPLIVAISGGVGPDIFIGASLTDVEYGINGVQVDLMPYLRRDGLLDDVRSDIFPGLLESSMWDGKLFGIPVDTQITMMFYNMNLLQSRGVAEPSEGWLWPDLYAQLPKLRTYREGEIELDALLANNAAPNAKFFMRIMGGYLWDPDTLYPMGRSEAFRRTFDTLWELTQQRFLRVGEVHLSAGNAVEQYVSGRAAYFTSGNFRLPNIEQDPNARDFTRAAPMLRWSTDVMPSLDGSHRSFALAKPASGQISDEVWQVFKHLISATGMARYSAATGLLPTRRSVLAEPVFRSFLRTTSPAYQYIAHSLIQYAYGPGAFGIPANRVVYSTIFTSLVKSFLSGDIALSAFIEEYDRKADVHLSQARAIRAGR